MLTSMQVYLDMSSARKRAMCECGWHGKPRWTRSSAVLDAGEHAAASGHLLTPTWVRLAHTSPAGTAEREPEVVG